MISNFPDVSSLVKNGGLWLQLTEMITITYYPAVHGVNRKSHVAYYGAEGL